MPISSKLQRFVEDELGRSAAMAERTVELTLEQLQQPREGMLSAAERQQYFELVQALKKHSPAFQREFCQTLSALVRANLEGQDSDYDEPAEAPGGLALMDEAQVEVDIELSSAADLIGSQADWELRELQTFTSTLAGQKHVSAETNPLRPLAYARALWQGTCVVTASPVQRVVLLRTASGVLSGQLKKSWAAACTRLEAQGVEPGMYRTVVITPGGGVKAPTYDVTRPGALEDLLPTMPAAAAPGSSAASGPAGSRRGRAGTPNPAFDRALVQLEQQLLRSLPAHGAAGQPAPQLGEHRATLMANAPETVDRQIVELLSRLFEAVLADTRLPAAFRTVMARLQVSALRVALVDPGMLETHEHPVWRLMNRIAIAAETHTQPNDSRLAALLDYCETLVGDMSREPLQDALLYRQSLTRLDAFLTEQLREQQLQSQSSVDALTQAELTPQEIVQHLRDEAVPEAPLSGQPFRDSLIDLSSMDTVPADAMNTDGAAQDDPSRRIDTMAPGGRYQMFLHGRWTHVQLLWRSPHGRFFLFAGADPNHAHSVTRRALERLSEESLLKPLDDASLIQRAVDSMMRKLTPSP